ncbi:MAG: hypothetical protein HYT79_04995, partial [Elusimicrobia bacterium]|nr:hypothetical protein [Elusimicrobiota bacterium]
MLKKRSILKRGITLLIALSLLITTPGLDFYQVFAQVIMVDGIAVDCSNQSHPACPSEGS